MVSCKWGLPALIFLVVMVPAITLAAVPNDQQISDAVEDELRIDRVVPVDKLDISTMQGVVTLSGKVDNILAKRRAARVAETVRGVRAVINKIDATPVKRPDPEIEQDIKNALKQNPATDAYAVNAAVKDGVVTLTGQAHSWREKDLAETVAAGVKGVKDIRNAIELRFKGERSDREIKADIEQGIRWDALLNKGRIKVDVMNGKVTLTGTVGSAFARTRAMTLAWVAGVNEVDAKGLEVAAWTDPGEPDRPEIKSDEEIRNAVKMALMLDPRTVSLNISPEVTAGVVTLRGIVDNLEAKRAAEQDAQNTVGVVAVKNRLKVRPTQEMDDLKVAEQIREAMVRDPFLEKYEISITVSGGIAYLAGIVDSYFEKQQAELVASRVNGVVAVENNIRVAGATRPFIYDPYVYDIYLYESDDPLIPVRSTKNDEELKQDIESQLFWSPFVDANQVEVSVENGIATLTGRVSSVGERQSAMKNAFDAGATQVVDKMEVK